MKEVIITRYKVTYNYSLGFCFIKHEDGLIDYIGASLERGWRDNQNGVSCVPEGNYLLKLEYSSRFRKNLWELKDVPHRAECKFHSANYWNQLNGCIALGNKHVDINKDGDPDVTSSRETMTLFHNIMKGDTARVIIKNL